MNFMTDKKKTLSFFHKILKKIGMVDSEKDAPMSAHGAGRKLRRRREHQEEVFKELQKK